MIPYAPKKPFLGMSAGTIASIVTLEVIISFISQDLTIYNYHYDRGCRANKNVVLATTIHGGHLAFFEGVTGSGLWYLILHT